MPQSEYTVSVDANAKDKMVKHTKFLAQVSVPAAQRLRDAYYSALKSLEVNPQRCPHYQSSVFIENELRFLIFSKRYRIVFEVVDNLVFVYDVQDARQDVDKNLI